MSIMKQGEKNFSVCALTFVCAADFERALYFGATIPRDWRRVWIVKSHEKARAEELASPYGIEVYAADFHRGRNLNGVECLKGMREVYLSFARENPEACFVKIDSDTALFEPLRVCEPITSGQADFVFFEYLYGLRGEHVNRKSGAGPCYAFRGSLAMDALACRDGEEEWKPILAWHNVIRQAEDVFFTDLFFKTVSASGRFVNYGIYKMPLRPTGANLVGAYAGHFGYSRRAEWCLLKREFERKLKELQNS